MQTMIGKIDRARFGFGGYQDAGFGLYVHMSGPGWGVSDFFGPPVIDMCEDEATTPTYGEARRAAARDEAFADTMRRVVKLCTLAKVKSVDELRSRPIEAVFENGVLKSWRVLTEVL